MLEVAAHGVAGEGFAGEVDFFLDEGLDEFLKFLAFDDLADGLVGVLEFVHFEAEVDDVGDVAFAVPALGFSGFDLFVLDHFLADEGHQEVVLEEGFVEVGVFGVGEGDLDDFGDFVVEDVVHFVLFHEGDDHGEEVVDFGGDLAGVHDVLLDDEPQDLDDLDPSGPDLGSAAGIDPQLLAALLDEDFQQLLELIDDDFFLRQAEGDVDEVGVEDGGVVDGDVFVGAHDVLDDGGDDVDGEEGGAELGDFVGGF